MDDVTPGGSLMARRRGLHGRIAPAEPIPRPLADDADWRRVARRFPFAAGYETPPYQPGSTKRVDSSRMRIASANFDLDMAPREHGQLRNRTPYRDYAYMEIAVPTVTPPEGSDPNGISIESARNLTIVYSLLIGFASVIAIIAGKDNWLLLLIPIAIVVSVGAFILRSPYFETRRWLPTLLLPVAVWLVTVFMKG